eukprot:CAMPEP_0119011176 /NCGR_PEP_ID=MMETSP1176-20130426/5499_1 /TAXON_ID=265551 /ORGANISM="Synedropsis recta cf, Strain CCMP1620" /LENGTH=1142 /DNA_ID=CAMNT_0006963953 /DNA_START=65 /DNA_END=3493 /DNA_ORIENTATION=+
MSSLLDPIKNISSRWKSNKTKQASTKDDDGEKHALIGAKQVPHPSSARATRFWDVQIPPAKKTMVGGIMIPTVESALGNLLQKHRRISVEIHQLKDDEGAADFKVLQEHLRGESLVQHGDDRHDDFEALTEGEQILVRVLKPIPADGKNTESRNTEEVIDEANATHATNTEFHKADEPDDCGWSEVGGCDLDDVEILKTRGFHCEMKFGRGSEAEIRRVKFGSVEEAESFLRVVRKLGSLESNRTKQRVEDYYVSHGKSVQEDAIDESGGIHIVVEIVSGIHLPEADKIVGTDPYVVVRMGTREVHCTKTIVDTVNPIWTIDSGAYFLLSATPEEFFASSSGVTFVVKNHDALGRDDIMGIVVLSQEELLDGNGERKEYPLDFGDVEVKDGSTGKLVCRFRKATKRDVEFIERLSEFQNSKKLHMFGVEKAVPAVLLTSGEAVVNFSRKTLSEEPGVYSAETFVPPRFFTSKTLQKKTKKAPNISGLPNGPKLIRVKPQPDPERSKATKWLTLAQIDAESKKRSQNWIEVGTGDLGKLFVEVLGCDDLPNMDSIPLVGGIVPAANLLVGGKTDAFACLIFEDCIVNTDVINDTLSPRWMPWTQRAFIFHIAHPSSQLLIGLLDFDSEMPGATHDGIGRVSVDISNFHPKTVYTLYYNLYTSALTEKRKTNGQLKIRLRIDWNDARKVALASMELPPQVYINVATSRDYNTAIFTCEGKDDRNVFNLGTLTEHVDEIQGYYKDLIPILRAAVFTVLLWRGHFPIRMRVPRCFPLSPMEDRRFVDRFTEEVTMFLPLHSLSAFIFGVVLAEHYNLLPSFILFTISWLMFATSGYLSHNPSPWQKPISFPELFSALAFGQTDVHTIQPYQNKDAIEKHDAWKKEERKKLGEEAEKKVALGSLAKGEGEVAAMNDVAEVEMATKNEGLGISFNPLEPILFPLQQNLHKLCIGSRITRSLITWQEPLYAFWIATACLIVGIVFLVVPWAFLMRWTIRVVIWLLLGPWMKLVDIYYVKRTQSDKDIQEAEMAQLRRKMKELRESATTRQTKREDLTKLKYLKRYMFGHYLLELPRFKESRYVDVPLMASHASPFVANTAGDGLKITSRKYGQQITGSIIPEREIEKSPTEASPLSKSSEVKVYGSTDA